MKRWISGVLAGAMLGGMTILPAGAVGTGTVSVSSLDAQTAKAYHNVLTQYQMAEPYDYGYGSVTFGSGLYYASLQDFNGDQLPELLTLQSQLEGRNTVTAEIWTMRGGSAVRVASGEMAAAYKGTDSGGVYLMRNGSQLAVGTLGSGSSYDNSGRSSYDFAYLLKMDGSKLEYDDSVSENDSSGPSARKDWAADGWTIEETLATAVDYGYVYVEYDAKLPAAAEQLRQDLLQQSTPPISGYQDVLSSLSAGDREALFGRFLGFIQYGAPADLDCASASDVDLAETLYHMWGTTHGRTFDTIPGVSGGTTSVNYGYTTYRFSAQEFSALTQQLFGRAIDYAAWDNQAFESAISYDPARQEVSMTAILDAGDFDALLDWKPLHLYQLSGNRYYAQCQQTWRERTVTSGAIVDRNADGTWTLVHLWDGRWGLTVPPTQTQLQQYAAAAPQGEPHFIDVSANAYYCPPVRWAVENGITNGTSSITFSPDLTCTTAQILTFLWKANGAPEPAAANPFSNLAQGQYYTKAALWAYEKGLIPGGVFSGDSPCTRADVVTYLWKLAGKPAGGTAAFADVPASASYAQAVAWAVKEGITSGTNDGKFSPDLNCTRAQIVTFLYRSH